MKQINFTPEQHSTLVGLLSDLMARLEYEAAGLGNLGLRDAVRLADDRLEEAEQARELLELLKQ